MIGPPVHPAGDEGVGGDVGPRVAGTAWGPHRENWAGFSRHSPPQAGGGTT